MMTTRRSKVIAATLVVVAVLTVSVVVDTIMRSRQRLTLANLLRDGKRLWAYCRDCQHNRFLDPHDIPLPPSFAVPEVGSRMKCFKCGSRNIHSKPEWFMGKDGLGAGG